MRVVRRLFAPIAAALLLGGCASDGASRSDDNAPTGALRIVAATELQDLQPAIDRAGADLGFAIEMEFPGGTLENSQHLKDGDYDSAFDATWFATNRYVDLLGATGRLGEATKVATSPVAFGVKRQKARELGWEQKQPTWSEIGTAAASGQLTFGMTDPGSSNSGFSALVSVATAYADTGRALQVGEVAEVAPQVREFLSGQTLTSGSSGWLKDTFLQNPDRADAIVNYESVLHSMVRDDGADIEVVVPADGVVSADYPLSTLSTADSAAAEKVAALTRWLQENPQELTDTSRRPGGDATLPAELSRQLIIESPFPGDITVTNALIDAYNNDLRVPGATTFVLDVSGSMEGQRLDSLKSTMSSLISGQSATVTGNVSLRERESVTLIPFNFTPTDVVHADIDQVGGPARHSLATFVDGFTAAGGTGLYDALATAFEDTETGAEGRIPSIVLMTDGEWTSGMSPEQFRVFHDSLPAEKKQIPVFVILYGEASVAEMDELAGLTGGRTFDALQGDLDAAFKEIRAYQ